MSRESRLKRRVMRILWSIARVAAAMGALFGPPPPPPPPPPTPVQVVEDDDGQVLKED